VPPAGVSSLVAALALASLVAAGPPVVAAGPPPSFCDRVADGEVAGRLQDPALAELSGVVASRRHEGVLWAHDDSGAAAELHALSLDGTALGTYPVRGAEAVDWEDIAIGPGPAGDGPVLYLGDVGDNDAARSSVVVYRTAEPADAPDAVGGTLEVLDATTIRHPGGPADVEALLVDPAGGDVLLVTKSVLGSSRLLRVDREEVGGEGVVEAEDLGSVPVPVDLATAARGGAVVTGGDVAPDGSVVLLRTYGAVLAYERPAGGDLVDALATEPCRAPERPEDQGEAVAFTVAGDAYLTISEGARVPVHRFAVEPPPAPASTTTTAPAVEAERVDEPSDDATSAGRALAATAAMVLAVAAVGIVVAVVRRRRPPR